MLLNYTEECLKMTNETKNLPETMDEVLTEYGMPTVKITVSTQAINDGLAEIDLPAIKEVRLDGTIILENKDMHFGLFQLFKDLSEIATRHHPDSLSFTKRTRIHPGNFMGVSGRCTRTEMGEFIFEATDQDITHMIIQVVTGPSDEIKDFDYGSAKQLYRHNYQLGVLTAHFAILEFDPEIMNVIKPIW